MRIPRSIIISLFILLALLPSSPALAGQTYVLATGATPGETHIAEHTAIAVLATGNPVIAYQGIDLNGNSGTVRLIACTTPDCSTRNAPVILDDNDGVGRELAMTINGDGNPVIVYHDSYNHMVKLVACTAPNCSTSKLPITLDDDKDDGYGYSITTGSDGNPLIAYRAWQQGQIGEETRVIACTVPDCSAYNAPIVISAPGDDTRYGVSIRINGDGYPVISYHEYWQDDLRVVLCTAPDCSTFDSPLVLDGGTEEVGQRPMMTINRNGNPVIAYRSSTYSHLKVIACTAPDCNTTNAPVVLEDGPNNPQHISIVTDAYGNPVISYGEDILDANLKFIRCTAPDCSTFEAARVLESNGITGWFTSITINGNDDPIISYLNSTYNQLKARTVNGATPPTITSPLPPEADINAPYSHTFTADGYPAPTFTLSGTLPPGIAFDGVDTISGAPLAVGNYPNIIVTATNSAGSDTQTFSLVVSAPAASICSITQLTNNAYNDRFPQIENGVVVWGGDSGNNYDIYLYDGATTTQLTDNTYYDGPPQIDGGLVVWHACNNDYDVYLYDGATTLRLTDDAIVDFSCESYPPQIDNGNVVWHGSDGNDKEIYLYDGVTVQQLTNNAVFDAPPGIGGDLIGWYRPVGGDTEMFLYDGVTTIQLTDNAYDEFYIPQIDGGIMVWSGQDATNSDTEVYLYDGTTIYQLTDDPYHNQPPNIDNGIVAWFGHDGNDIEVFMYDGAIHQLTNNAYDDYESSDFFPAMSDGKIAWPGYDGNDYEIFLYDGTTVHQITNNDYDDLVPFINGNEMVWHGWDGSDYEIFVADCTAQQPPIITSPLPPVADMNVAYSHTFTVDGYPEPTFTLSGTLPPGITFDGVDTISGTPTVAGVHPNITMIATNNAGSDTQTFELAVNGTPTIISQMPPSPAIKDEPYSFTFTSTGYPAPTFTITGDLPDGITFDGADTISGTPTTIHNFVHITVTATNGSGSDSQEFNIMVKAYPDKLILTSMCAGYWRVRNPNPIPIDFTWEVLQGSTETGSGTVASLGELFFNTSVGPLRVRLYSEGRVQDTKDTNPTSCDEGQGATESADNITNAFADPFAAPGDTTQMNSTVGNPGTEPLTDVLLTYAIPGEMDVLSVTASDGTVRVVNPTGDLESPPPPLTRFVVGYAPTNNPTTYVLVRVMTWNPGDVVSVDIDTQVRLDAVPPYILTTDSCMISEGLTDSLCNSAALPNMPPPTDLTVTAMTLAETTLGWTDHATTETNYKIYRSEDGLSWAEIDMVGADVTTYTDTITACDTVYPYLYRVQAYNAGDGSASEVSNTVRATTNLCATNIQITQTGPPEVINGDEATYMLTVTNTGTLDASGLVITNVLLPDVIFVDTLPFSIWCENDADVVTCNIGLLPGGESVEIDVIVRANTTADGITNQATVTMNETDTNTADNLASRQTIIIPVLDIVIDEQALFNQMAAEIASNPAIEAIEFVLVDFVDGGMVLTISANGTMGHVSVSLVDDNGWLKIEITDITVDDSEEEAAFTEAVHLELPVLITASLDAFFQPAERMTDFAVSQWDIRADIARRNP